MTENVSHNGNNWYYDTDYKLHREDGPAVEYHGGGHSYYKHGLLHREDGPAVYLPYGNQGDAIIQWYFNGVKLTEDEFTMIKFFNEDNT